jgi:hypothetical protein
MVNYSLPDVRQAQSRFYVEYRPANSPGTETGRFRVSSVEAQQIMAPMQAAPLMMDVISSPLLLLPPSTVSAARVGTDGEYFDFEDNATAVFANIRKAAGITTQVFKASMCAGPLDGGFKGEGKSGMSFFFTRDGQYVIKTVKASEMQFLLQVRLNRLADSVCTKECIHCRFCRQVHTSAQ